MTQKPSSDKERSHDTGHLFTEWPTPADTVEGFGGNPNHVDHNQWKKKSSPGEKPRH